MARVNESGTSDIARLRNSFYRDNYRRLIGMLLVMVFINVILVGVVIYLINNRPEPSYFASGANGRAIPLYPLSQPIVSKAELLRWASQAATATYTYNFLNYREELARISEYFTPDGWKQFQRVLQETGNLNNIIAKKLIMTAVATGAPVITDEGVLNGRYSWRIQIPLLITYEGAGGEKVPQPIVVMMVVIRVPTTETPRGVGIVQFTASSGRTQP